VSNLFSQAGLTILF